MLFIWYYWYYIYYISGGLKSLNWKWNYVYKWTLFTKTLQFPACYHLLLKYNETVLVEVNCYMYIHILISIGKQYWNKIYWFYFRRNVTCLTPLGPLQFLLSKSMSHHMHICMISHPVGNFFSVGKFDWKQIPSLKWAEKIILWALCALKNIVFVEKKYCCEKKYSAARRSEKKNILTPKKPIAPSFKLNGCSLRT